ncbi:MAG: ABC transporter ATP-binding protein [Candidatus Edwardsbacteria bacterium]|nr:ABC transporter ATP-binding protein [Candidatus Edwardsbacteria bacterium]MBU1577627.1 ABC transporter ATP-binding protein [Candidatus Edwardsbacteria bacterium]MBU2462966.1 ABC transporter ATP-binding protein [Candidatus Edwardsbacteria bacterium]MBU2595093.1 ABC transporter ATP-binding protein [Candidatus Edwardsbacteria bacterium]
MKAGIELTRAVKRFGDKTAVDGLSISVKPGEIFGLLGPNGAGKTTSLKMLAGLMKPDSGSASICGMDIHKEPEKAKMQLGYIPDDSFIYDLLTGREFLRLVGHIYKIPKEDIEPRINRLAEEFDAVAWLDQRTEGYSHGMRQKVVIAAAMLHDPLVYLIDEPMVGLDPASMITVRNIFKREAAKGKALLISTHTLSLAQAVCHRIGIIANGKLVALGTLDELRSLSRKQHKDLEDLYLEFTV